MPTDIADADSLNGLVSKLHGLLSERRILLAQRGTLTEEAEEALGRERAEVERLSEIGRRCLSHSATPFEIDDFRRSIERIAELDWLRETPKAEAPN